MQRLDLNVCGHGVVSGLPLNDGDYIDRMFSEDIDGVEWLFIGTAHGRRFLAEPNDAGGLNVSELADPKAEAEGL